MIIVKPSKDILQLNKGFRFERNSSAFDEEGNLFLPHNARFLQGKFGKALFVEEGTDNLLNGLKHNNSLCDKIWHTPYDVTLIRIRLGNATNHYELEFMPNVEYTATVTILQIDALLRDLNIGIITDVDIWKTLTKPGVYTITHSRNDGGTRAVFYCPHMGFPSDEKYLGDMVRLKFPQVEQKPYATTFIPSIRSPEIVTIPVNTISPTGGQWDHYAYVNDMARRQVAGQTPTLFHIPRQDGGMGIRVCHAEDSANWKLQTMDDTNNITEAEALDTLTPDGWHRFTVKWTEAEAKLLIDGVVAGTIANPALPSVFAQDAYVGSYDGSKDFLNTLHDDIRVSNIARADADDLADYQADQPLPTDSSTIHKQSFDSPNNTYVRQGLIL